MSSKKYTHGVYISLTDKAVCDRIGIKPCFHYIKIFTSEKAAAEWVREVLQVSDMEAVYQYQYDLETFEYLHIYPILGD